MGQLISVVLMLAATQAQGTDCDALYGERIAVDLELPYTQFDQTHGSGFRVLAEAGCHMEAAALIALYIAHNDAPETSLRWHAAQMLAHAGEYEAAIDYARSTLVETEDHTANALRWNAYVHATIAFLEQDLASLQRHRNAIAAGVEEHAGNGLNLRLVDSLIRNFDSSYLYAVTHIDAAPAEAQR